MCGGGAGMPANTSSQVTTSNIPTYMQPYATAMLGAGMGNVFNYTQGKNGQIDITGQKGYTPYGVNPALGDAVATAQANLNAVKYDPKNPQATIDAQNAYNQAVLAQQQATQQAYGIDPATGQPVAGGAAGSAYVAGLSPMQQQAFAAAQGLQLPGQFAQATDYTNQAAQGSLGIAGLTPGLANASMGYGATGAGYGATGAGYGAIASQIGQEAYQRAVQNAAYTGNQADIYGGQAAQTGLQGLGYGAQGAGYGAQAAGMAGMGYGAGQQYAQEATSPGAVQAYMNPYIQASLAPQLQQLAQQTGINTAAEQAAATSSGAFGGSREALANALQQQSGNLAAQQALGQGYNTAYNNALQNMQFGSTLGVQGLQAGTQAQLAGMQGAQTGIAGISPALQGYQTGLQGVGQQINAGQLALQGAGVGIQGQQAGIQGASTGIQGAQTGIQGTQGATAADQLGLQSYGQVGAQGTNLANIGNMQLGAQQGIIGLQSQLGGIQQQQNQNIIDAAMNQYQTQQQYPYQQLGFLNSLLRGLPTQSSTQQNYMAAPNPYSQAAGMGLKLASYGMKSGGIVDAALARAMA
jgi:hypothetical protein